ncbi:hypothetical protein HanOQP8_Chr17g0682971 [Helianthus annuus]|nr:hypothetical protein HanOQP8_Chr17g0682971 [Helianthus annuus]
MASSSSYILLSSSSSIRIFTPQWNHTNRKWLLLSHRKKKHSFTVCCSSLNDDDSISPPTHNNPKTSEMSYDPSEDLFGVSAYLQPRSWLLNCASCAVGQVRRGPSNFSLSSVMYVWVYTFTTPRFYRNFWVYVFDPPPPRKSQALPLFTRLGAFSTQGPLIALLVSRCSLQLSRLVHSFSFIT